MSHPDGKILRVLPESPKFMLRKVDELFVVADMELGIRIDVKSSIKPSSVYLIYVCNKKRISGFVAAERIYKANRLLTENPFTCSKEIDEADIGIVRLWVHPKYRNSKIATKLLNALRENFVPGKSIDRKKIAFSDPTNGGKEFAKKYTGDEKFLVFNPVIS